MSSNTPLIVIVDDTPKNLQILGTILRKEGYAVLAITDSKKALPAIEKKQPDLVLLDIMMPNINGYEVCAALKSNPKTHSIPVIFITAKTESSDIIEGFRVGGVDYITKPFNSEELLVRVDTQLKLQDAIKQAQKANAVKSEFLANMSHDLRSPLTSIMGVMKLMQGDDLTPEHRNYINIAQKAGTSLLCLINDILDLSKIEAEQLELNQVKFDIQETLNDIMDILCINAFKKGLELNLIIDPIIPTPVIGDPERFKQIVINLLSNAIKFTSHGEVSIFVSLENQTDEQLVYSISIQDTGCGIHEDKIDKLFKSYTQADSTISRQYGGTGLGLSISKKLIEMMNGSISVESEVDKGTTFKFTISLKKQQTEQDFPIVISKIIKEINILLIDKNKQARTSFSCQLRRLNSSFHEAFDSMSTMSKIEWISLENKKFDIVFVDKETFDYDIKNIFLSMSKKQPLKNTKFITLHKLGKEPNLSGIFHDSLTKPVRFDNLLECLQKNCDPDSNEKKERNELNIKESIVQKSKFSKINILVIDDAEINLLISKDFFERIGYIVDTSPSSHDALMKMKNKHYDFIFTDLQMPELNGIELTKIIRNPDSEVKNHDAYIVAVTASSMKQDKEDSFNAGMNAYLVKPFELHHLKDIIENKEVTNETDSSLTDKAKLFDEAEVLKRLNNHKRLLLKLIDNYLNSHFLLFEKLKISIDELKYEDIIFLSHRLKGEVGNLTKLKLIDLYQSIHQAAKTEDIQAIKNYYEKLKIYNDQFDKELITYKEKVKLTG